jgi:heme A synthase
VLQSYKDQPTHILISVILPLSLVWRGLGNSDYPNPGAKLLKLHSPKGLGEKVCQLILGVDVAVLDAPLVQAAPNEVVLDADVLATLMEDGVLC